MMSIWGHAARAALISVIALGPVSAQEGEPAAETETTKAPPLIPEIIVTAQKRSENIQDVPISVSAIGGDALQAKAIDRIDDVATLTPNLDISALPRSSYIRIRGLGSGDNKGFEQSIGLFVDGVYFGRAEYLNDALLDVDRVEVLRGPQGTLFGKNTVAGAISVFTKNPSPDYEVYGSYLYGRFNQHRIQGAVNIPLFDEAVGIRVAGKDNRRDGYIYNRKLDRDEADINKTYVRAKASLLDLSGITITLGGDYGTIDGKGNGYQLSALGDLAETIYRAFDPDLETDLDDYETSLDYPGYVKRDTINLNLTAETEIGGHTLTAITGWSTYDFEVSDDVDFGPAPLLSFLYDDTYTQVSQEVRVTSGPGEFEYVGGLYYFYSDYDAVTDFTMLPDFNLLDELTQDTLANFLPGLVTDLLDLLGPITGPLGNLTTFTADNRHKTFRQFTNHAAVFGQVDWHVTDWFTAIAGIRYTYERKDHTQQQSFDGTGLPYMLITGDTAFRYSKDRTESNFAPKASVKFNVTEEIMVYGTWARGFKGGGFNEMATSPLDAEFEEEKSDTFEAGVKSTLWDGRMTLNLSYFYTSFDNLQVAVWDGTGFIVTNAEEATTQGVELESRIVPVSGLTFQTGLGWTDATYDKFTNGPCKARQPGNANGFCDLSGQRLNQAPKWNVSAALDYETPLFTWPVSGFIGGDVYYQTHMFLTPDNDDFDSQDAYTLVSARAGLRFWDQQIQIAVIGKNLLNQTVKQESFDVPLFTGSHFAIVGPPRTIIGEISVNF